jgi:hypothetical protein
MSRTSDSPPPRKPRVSACIEIAISESKALPLEVLLETMWHLRAEAQRLEASGDPKDARLARFAHYLAFRVAVIAAPYVHPRIAPTATDFEDGNPAVEDHFARSDRLLEWRLKKLSVAQLHALWDRIKAGDPCDVVLSEMTDTRSIQ